MKFLAVSLLGCLALHGTTLIEDVTIIDVATGAAYPHRNVLIKGDRIVSTGASVSPGEFIVNGRGKFLIPGLWNMHVHLAAEQQLASFITQGITGVEDAGSDFSHVSAWRNAIDSGKAVGPRIITSGPAVADRFSGDLAFPVLAAGNPRDARKAFDRLWDMNVDFITVQPDLSADAYFALAEQARHWHLRVEGEVPTAISAWDALGAHQNSIDLPSVLKAVSTDSEAIRFFEDCATRGIRIAPMLVEARRASPERMTNLDRLVALSTRTSVELLAGTGSAVQDELEELVDAGMTPGQALRTATIAPAHYLESAGMGAIEAGKVADLVLLNANPLLDIHNARKIAGVFSRGKYYPRTALNTPASAN